MKKLLYSECIFLMTHCNTLQHTATHCNTLQRTHIYLAVSSKTLRLRFIDWTSSVSSSSYSSSFLSSLSVVCVFSLQNQRQHTSRRRSEKSRVAMCCNVLPCVAVCRNVLQCVCATVCVCCFVLLNRYCWIVTCDAVCCSVFFFNLRLFIKD